MWIYDVKIIIRSNNCNNKNMIVEASTGNNQKKMQLVVRSH
jgi:hypothetical protein